MGKIGTAAGGGRVTATGLLPENIKAGETVEIKQGSKVVESVQGALTGYLPVGYTMTNGHGYSDTTCSWGSFDQTLATGGSRLTIKKAGTYYTVSQASWNTMELNGGTYSNGNREVTLKPGDYFSCTIGSSDGNGNGSGMAACFVLYKGLL